MFTQLSKAIQLLFFYFCVPTWAVLKNLFTGSDFSPVVITFTVIFFTSWSFCKPLSHIVLSFWPFTFWLWQKLRSTYPRFSLDQGPNLHSSSGWVSRILWRLYVPPLFWCGSLSLESNPACYIGFEASCFTVYVPEYRCPVSPEKRWLKWNLAILQQGDAYIVCKWVMHVHSTHPKTATQLLKYADLQRQKMSKVYLWVENITEKRASSVKTHDLVHIWTFSLISIHQTVTFIHKKNYVWH